MENERLDFINSLECKRIYPGDSSVLPALENFDCGDKEKYSYGVSSEMLKRLKRYIFSNNSEQINDIYYVVWDKTDIYLFFSLQTSLVFSTKLISPENIGQIKKVYKLSEVNLGYGSSVSETLFSDLLGNFEELNDKYTDADIPHLMKEMQLIKECKSQESQNNLYVDKSIPSIEMVNFCKNYGSMQKWSDAGIDTPIGATLFWYKILPIIKEVSDKIGCVYVTLFAADATLDQEYGNRNLLSYYENAFKFQNDSSLSALKPYYDWKCIFLCQKILTLCEEEKSFKENFLSGISDDDV